MKFEVLDLKIYRIKILFILFGLLLFSCSTEYKTVDGVIIASKAVIGPKGIGFRSVCKFQYFDSLYLDTIEIMDKNVFLIPCDSIQIEINPLDKLDHRVLKILYRTSRH